MDEETSSSLSLAEDRLSTRFVETNLPWGPLIKKQIQKSKKIKHIQNIWKYYNWTYE